MSPLWPDLALARAAWANAVKRGLVNDSEQRANGPNIPTAFKDS
ncbi:MAG: hypothetical protein ACJ8F4_05375 [Sphingomonas sp.]